MLIPLQSELSCYFFEHVSDFKLGLWLELSHVQVTEQDLSGSCYCGVNAATGTAEQVMLQESQAANPSSNFGNQHCACLSVLSYHQIISYISGCCSATLPYFFPVFEGYVLGKYPFVSSPHHLFLPERSKM